ncbi:MAG TPA: slipin family protein [Streptosporangiaceae bacterium]|jgi:regulator of protease activity HflC (stomatin/prohibitin superfamily)
MARDREIIIKSTHRGLRYEDGRLTDVLEAGRYELPSRSERAWGRRPVVEIQLVDMRERELTIKGQEILTSDKVAVRVSIITQFQVVDPVAALQKVESYTDRLYSDVQLAARRSLASMTLEAILTNRNQLSEDILRDVKDAAAGYGVAILRADVKDLVFPGNLQEIMNRVLAAERLSEAQLVEARTKAERESIEARSRAEAERVAAQTRREAARADAETDAEAQRIRAAAEAEALRTQADAAAAYAQHPVLLRVRELETLARLATNAEARLYIGFDKHVEPNQPE